MKTVKKRTIWEYLRPYRHLVVIAPLLMLLEVASDLTQPQLMAVIIDKGVATGDVSLILNQGLKMVGITLIGLLGGIGCFYTSTLAAESFAADLREGLFKKVESFSFENMDHFNGGTLITRLTNDITQVSTAVGMMLRMMIRAPFLFIGSLIMTIILSPHMAGIFLITLPAVGLVITLLIVKGFPLFRSVRVKLDTVNTVMRENLTGVRLVKAFVRNDFEEARFEDANLKLMAVSQKVMRLMAFAMPAFSFIMYTTVIATVWFGGLQVQSGGLEIGELMAFIQYVQILLMALMMIAMFMAMLVSGLAAKERMNEILNETVNIVDPAVEPKSGWAKVAQGRVEFQSVSFKYDSGEGDCVLKNVSFTAEPGQTIAVIGATGSGKSTLMHLMSRLYEATEGRILIDGRDVRQYRLKDLRSGIGMAMQKTQLFGRSIKENIAYGRPSASDDDIAEAARAAQAEAFIQEHKNGLDYQVSQGGNNLSGGQKQRISIARALCSKPKILIFDDVTSAVDVTTELKIRSTLKRQTQNRTCFIVAQRISSVLHAEKILVLDDGVIVGQGRHEDLLQTCSIYREIYESQLGNREEVVNG